jgi:hypothetical protein
VGRTYLVSSGSVAVSGMLGKVKYSGDVNSLNVDGSSGTNEMVVVSTSARAPLGIYGGSGTNNVGIIASSSAVSVTGPGTNNVTVGTDGSLTGITAPVNVSNSSNANGTLGKSYVTINGSNDSVGRNYTITSSSVAVQGLTTINLSSTVAGTTINDAIGKANAYTVNSVLSTDPVTINGDALDTLSGPAFGQVAFRSAHS